MNARVLAALNERRARYLARDEQYLYVSPKRVQSHKLISGGSRPPPPPGLSSSPPALQIDPRGPSFSRLIIDILHAIALVHY